MSGDSRENPLVPGEEPFPHSSAPSEISQNKETPFALLRREQEQLVLGQQIGDIGSFEWDIQNNHITWSHELEALYGLPAGGFTGKYEQWVHLIYADDRQQVQESLQKAINGGPALQAEFRVIWPDKSIHWLLAKGSIIFDKARNPLRMSGIHIDITERKEAEEQLAWQATLLQSAHDAFIVSNQDNKVLFWNNGASALYGWTEQEALGKPLYTLLHTIFPLPLKEIQQILREKGTWEGELIHTRRDGTYLFVSSRWVMLEQRGRRAITVLEVNRDITSFKHSLENIHFLSEASKQLSTSLDFRKALIEVARLAVPVMADWCRVDLLDEDGVMRQVITVRSGLPETTDAEEALPEQTPMIIANILHNARPELYPFVSEELLTRMGHKEPQLAWLRQVEAHSAMFVPLISQGETHGVLSFLVTETRRNYTRTDLATAEELASRMVLSLENARIYQDLQNLNANLETLVERRTETLRQSTDALQALNAELQRSNQELQDFAYVASHDLQEPLRKIQAFGNLLEEEHGPELGEGRSYLDRMRKAASRMQVLINDLLTFSRVTTKALPFTPVDLQRIAQEVVDDLETQIQQTRATVQLEDLPTIQADPLQMRQMLQNLIGNALKFRKKDTAPVVKVYARKIRDEASEEQPAELPLCQIFVEDNGIGFDEKYLDRIFTVFQRLHGRSEYEGTGIGLAVVRKIAERHGGTVTARSAVGDGATFAVTLPIGHETQGIEEKGDQ
ncbi:PAS domain S-box protein [Ktedonosporobacter rubrisoli]|uniref:histidine kinase n=1 Tax=Ktedonosporobacter rubrisoli TaxID=2509675 RepID=A0A4P6JJM4_KTERU|nr:PAS domain-containing protein [Ktedonosporobacter rubrisoli]QBD75324.1 PAS domain S-box protein [Ktedonosporobacter rubrisoli]